ncbi:MAG: sarcosine oxidase subunit alpha family protein [Rhizobiales bacterium]|nr:sarcosine oxidase subunit alpha family protein [Hyphomicrobiales bacterium]
MAGYRLPRGGGRIDRSRGIRFSFDGASVGAFAGDTVASALLASGRTLVARSFKYHRPRGVFTAGSEEPNALVTLGAGGNTEPNAKATIVDAAEGLVVRSQNAWPSLGADIGAAGGLLSPFFAAGFYYKTFIGPYRGAWMLYEPFIRRAAGLGRASFEPDRDRYETGHVFCDVLVVGGGPAGLAAALEAADAGARVILCDDNIGVGGALDLEDGIQGQSVADWLFATISALRAFPNFQLLTRTSVYGYYDGNILGAVEQIPAAADAGSRTRQRHWRIQARRVVLATGALERPFVFPGNDTPGVMLGTAGLAYARRYGVAVGREVVVFTNNDSGWTQAAALSRAGIQVRAVVDPRTAVPGRPAAELSEAGAEFLSGHVVTAANGGKALSSVRIEVFDANTGHISGAARDMRCDSLLVSAGWNPLVHLASQAGGPPVYDEQLAAFLPGEPREAWRAVGAMAGTFGADDAAAEGRIAGAAAARELGFELPGKESSGRAAATEGKRRNADNLLPLFEIPAEGKAFVDLQNDVTASDVRLARQEGFESVEHLKRYTTLGMAADQGKTSNLNGLAILAAARKMPVPAVGTTRFRAPYNPISLGALAGRARDGHFQPLRRMPLHDWHVKAGADMMNVGLWQRPRAYLWERETLEHAYVREARAVRQSVGITDVSTLGKIDVQGPDAATFLDRVYTNTFSTLAVGKARYGLMLREDGFLFDDGTTWRLADTRYLMTTTTANAALVMQHLEMLLAIAWPELRVSLASLTDHWAGIAVSGPNSRALLERVVDDIDVSDAALPVLAVRAGQLSGFRVLVARLSFSGERAYEVYCGADYAHAVWERLLASGKDLEVVPYGLEALGTLRIEKGHITGSEIDGRTTVHDIGLDKMFSMKKDFVGKPLALRPALTDPGRKQLVGLKPLDGKAVLNGAHLVAGADPKQPGRSQGHVTSMCYSPAVDGYIALALVERGRARHGETLHAADPLRGGHGAIEIVDPCFFDRDGSRMHG